MSDSNSKKHSFSPILILMNWAYHLGRMFAVVYSLKLNLLRQNLINSFYSGWHLKKFKHCGKNLSVAHPLNSVGLNYISIGNNFISGPRLRLEAHDRSLHERYTPKITIGDDVNINFDCHIGCIDEIEIGNGVLIGSKVLIIDHSHGSTQPEDMKLQPIKRSLISKGAIKIGKNVWIGEGCVLMPGVKIGDNCIVGANSVITKSFEANCIIGGNPAKIIKLMI